MSLASHDETLTNEAVNSHMANNAQSWSSQTQSKSHEAQSRSHDQRRSPKTQTRNHETKNRRLDAEDLHEGENASREVPRSHEFPSSTRHRPVPGGDSDAEEQDSSHATTFSSEGESMNKFTDIVYW